MKSAVRNVCLAAGLATSALIAPPASAYDVTQIGSFYIGGTPVTLQGHPKRTVDTQSGGAPQEVDINGEFHTGQMYVQYVQLKSPAAKYPLLMWHTGGITGASWETKPDGRPGWMQYFLRRGHNVYVSDAVERGRATFSRFPEIYKSEPIFRDRKEAWEIFRIGAAGSYSADPLKRAANPGQRFPLEAFDALQMQMAPRWATNGNATQAAYNALVDKACPCIIMAHGQAGLFAFNAALANPAKVKGVIAIEPAFAPKPAVEDVARLAAIPHLFVWGDFIDTHPVWIDHVRELKAYHGLLKANHVPVEWFDLPEAGIRGNTHMIMMDNNSDLVAGRIQSWLTKKRFMRPTGPVTGANQLRVVPINRAALTRS
jgi:hypothetical protein